MKKLILIGMLFNFFLFANDNTENRVLVLNIEGLRNLNGNIIAYLFDNQHSSQFPKVKFAKDSITAIVIGNQVSVQFSNLKSSTYALMIHHDEDRNRKLKTGFLKLPKEGIGFSNNIKPKFGPPDFQKTKISMDADTVIHTIDLIYF